MWFARFMFKAALIVCAYALGGLWGIVALLALGVAIGSAMAIADASNATHRRGTRA